MPRADCGAFVDDVGVFQLCSHNQFDENSQFELGQYAFDRQDYQTAILWFSKAAAKKPYYFSYFVGNLAENDDY